MKKIMLLMFLLPGSAFAQQWYENGILVSNVCSNAYGFYVYPIYNHLPVGSSCFVPGYGYGIAGG